MIARLIIPALCFLAADSALSLPTATTPAPTSSICTIDEVLRVIYATETRSVEPCITDSGYRLTFGEFPNTEQMKQLCMSKYCADMMISFEQASPKDCAIDKESGLNLKVLVDTYWTTCLNVLQTTPAGCDIKTPAPTTPAPTTPKPTTPVPTTPAPKPTTLKPTIKPCVTAKKTTTN